MEKLSHALLFVGSKDRIVAAAEDVLSKLVSDQPVLDVMRLSPELDKEGTLHDISVDETKKLKTWISRRPVGKFKCVVINDADRLGTEAANNLLKILEEPPEYAHFILLTSQPNSILPTVLSRCERRDFRETGEKAFTQEQDVAIKEFETILNSGITERILFSKKIADSDNVAGIVSCWLSYVSQNISSKPELASVAHGLIELYAVVSKPQFNQRLALENFLLSC